MEEVKIRVWDKEENKMISGDNFAFEEYAPLNDLFHNNSKRFDFMLYIGCKDINAKEIYEGDIVEIVGNPSMHPNLCYIGTKFKVFYNKKSCSFMMQDISNKNNVQYFDLDLGGISSKDLLVIGNIYKDKRDWR
jgi:uncharacterized phage protein (TIGR01671 family)